MPTPLELKKRLEEHKTNATGYRKSEEDKASYDFVKERVEFLKEYRRNNGIEKIWKAADKAYVPHMVDGAGKGRKVLVSDDEMGWRSQVVDLQGEDSWQEESVPPNPYIKIQTALGIIVDQNPAAVLEPGAKKYERNRTLVKNLYERSWDIAYSKTALLKPLVFNTAKYGMGVGRTYPLRVTRDVRDLVKYDAMNPKKNKYVESEHSYYDDIFRESLSPWDVWFDDASVVGNPFSCNDAVYFKDYDWVKFERTFKHLKNFKYVVPKQQVVNSEGKIVDSETATGGNTQSKLMERVWFYENLEMDLFLVWTESGVVLVNEPMPQKPKNKRLSVWNTLWTLRDDKSIYGIGVYEAMRNDHQIHVKIRNMTVDQLVLSIYREFFYSGTDTLENDGVMRISPGKGRQVTDPKNISWNEVPGPGQEAWLGEERFRERIDDATGISRSLEGTATGATAFEISQTRESALKRMKTPLENITDGLVKDAYISLGILEDLYSIPKIKLIAQDKYIEAFEIDLYERNDGEPLVEGTDYVKEDREVPLKLEVSQNDELGGNDYSPSDEVSYVKLSPDDLSWEGVIKIDGKSIVANSELLNRVTTVELANIIVPLFSGPPEIGMKPAKRILEEYDEDPIDWLPDAWLNPPAPEETPLFAGAEEEVPVEEEAEPIPDGLEKVNGDSADPTANGPAQGLVESIKSMA